MSKKVTASARWFQDIRSTLQLEVQAGLEEAVANSPADGWTTDALPHLEPHEETICG